MKKFTNLRVLVNDKHINLLEATYKKENGVDVKYEIATRRKDINDMAVYGSKKVDTVRVLPYMYKNGELQVLIIKEFRYAINDYIHSLPAGLVDEGENVEQSAKRELEEETGAKAKHLEQLTKPCFISAGFSDENVVCFEAEIDGFSKQDLGRNEEIGYKLVSLKALDNMLENENFDIQSLLLLKEFALRQRLKKLQNELEK